ncbi:hypothetical protein [Microbacterium sp. NPDC058389]|uniref:hypothetical protein n=1 Tax=Microbacterium sp. NPDC058389 TaxID=3346475 RepID=UPI00365D78F6
MVTQEVASVAPAEESASPSRRILGLHLRGGLLWYLLSVAAVLLMALARIVREPRFFFWDDTQLGAFGQWYGLGTRILAGDLTILAPGAWQGGNYLAEGQWGIWNPVVWVIAVFTHVFDGATATVTVVKLLFLVLLCTGAYLLAREYGAAPWWAAVAGFTATAGGQTIFMDAPSWVTGLQNVALFALTWWALKRHVDRGRSPVPFFALSYVLIAFGYVFGAIELAVLLIVVLVEKIIRRSRAEIVRVLVLGAFAGFATVFVYLPGLLTSPVTVRSGSAILNDQFLNMDVGDLLTSPIATGTSSVRGYWGDLVPVPLQYVTWLLPVFILIATGWRRSLRELAIPLAVLVITTAFVIGPSVLGPLRYPARMMPYVVLCVAVVFAVVATNGWNSRPSRRRVLIAVGATIAAGWLSWAAQPSSWLWVCIGVLVQSAAIVVVGYAGARGGRDVGMRAAAWTLVASLLVLVPQIYRYPSSPLGNFNVPSSVTAMHDVGSDMDDGIFTVGDVYSLQQHPDAYDESLLANLWYLTKKDAASVYTVLPFTTYAAELCVDIRGKTCPEALDALFEDREHPLADDMALNTVVVIKGDGLEDRPKAPEGWTVTDSEYVWVLHRDEPVDRAGGVARASEGTSVTVLDRDDTSVRFTVDEVAASGGQVIFSRLAWPGYTVDGAELGDPARDFLLTVDVTAEDVGKVVTVTFRPPGWGIELTSVILAGLLAVAWTIVFGVVRRRGQRAGGDRQPETM